MATADPTTNPADVGTASAGTGLTLSAGVLTSDLSTGKAGGQTITGGTAAGDVLTERGSSHASGGPIAFQASATIASAAGATWKSLQLGSTATATLSGSTSVTTSTGFNMVEVATPTITSASALTVTSAATLAILGAPAAGGSTTITNAYSLWAQGGVSRFDAVGTATSGTGGTASIVLNATTAGNVAQLFFQDAGNTRGWISAGGSTNIVNIGAPSTSCARFYHSNSTLILTLDQLGLTVAEAMNLVLGTTTGTKIGTATTQKLGFYNVTPIVQPTRGGTLTNNVTAGGSTDVIANYTDLTTYANDAAAIRNNIYQLARAVNQHDVALRALGLES